VPAAPVAEPPPAESPVAEQPDTAPPAPALSEAVAPVDPVDVAASTEPVVGPAIKPVVIGESDTTVERKRGWWRR
jgi:hypothetical protein